MAELLAGMKGHRQAWLALGQWRLLLDLLAVVGLGLMPLLFFWRLLTPNPADVAIIRPGDFTDVHYPFRSFVTRELIDGRLSLWNPFVLSGHSSLGDVQFALFYPVNLALSYLLGRDGLSLLDLELHVVLHFSLAGIFTYLFAKRVLRSRAAALTSALVFAYGGYLTSFPVQQINLLETSAWLPLILLLLDKGLDERQPGYVALAGVSLALAALVGHPQTLLYVLAASVLYGLYKAWGQRSQGARRYLAVPLFVALGLGLSSIQLVPAYEHLGLTTRAEVSYRFTSTGFELKELVGLLLPGEWGGTPLYVGVLPLFLSGFAIVRARGGGPRVFWAALALIGLLVSFGGNTFLHSLLYLAAPGLRSFRQHERTVLLFALALAMLSGYGLKDLAECARADVRQAVASYCRGLRWLVLMMILVSLVFLYAGATVRDATQATAAALTNRAFFALLFVALSAGLVHLYMAHSNAGNLLAIAALALIGLDLFSTNWQNNLQDGRPDVLFPVPKAVGLFRTDLSEPVRVASEGLLPGNGNAGSLFALQDVVGNTPLQIERYAVFERNIEEWQRWQLLNVKYVMTKRELKDGRFRLLDSDKGVNTYEILPEHRLPRAYVVHRVVVAESDGQSLQLLKGIDLRREAVLRRPPGLALPDAVTTPSTARITKFEPGRIVLDADLRENGVLILSEIDHPGWQAYVDRQPETILQANYLLRGLPLVKGAHVVELLYDPPSLKLGVLLTILSTVATLALLAFFLRRR
ncbi:MAG: YfhO family protein [Chloroflexi bacterium]|nr:YfhO family protein [Chloroflexota bacterium]